MATTLLIDRHQQLDLFVCSFSDISFKGDNASLSHPVFSLTTHPTEGQFKCYEHGNNILKVYPSQFGYATVKDRDIIIYGVSQLVAAMNRGFPLSKRIRFKAYDLLINTNRPINGAGYSSIKTALHRLQGTQIETNIKQGGREYFKLFSLVDSAEAIKEGPKGRMSEIELVMSDWLMDAVENKHILTLNRQYFQLSRPIERRLYEIALKHCANKNIFCFGLENIQQRVGSHSDPREFRRTIKTVIKDDQEHGHMPDYCFDIHNHNLIIMPKHQGWSNSKINFENLALKYASSHDPVTITTEYHNWINKRSFKIYNPKGHFIAFCKSKEAERLPKPLQILS